MPLFQRGPQACHPLVPPDAISPVVKALADRFISDRSTPNVMTVGLNAVREICVRCPYVMDEDLLQVRCWTLYVQNGPP